MKPIVLLGLFLVFYFTSALKAQDYEDDDPAFSFDPIQLISFYNSSIYGYYEYKVSKKIRIEHGLGFILPIDLWSGSKTADVSVMNNKGLKVKNLLKYRVLEMRNAYLFASFSLEFAVENYVSRRSADDALITIVEYEVVRKNINPNFQIGIASYGQDYRAFSQFIPSGIRFDHFSCVVKKFKFKAENVDRVGTLARLSNAEIRFFSSK